MSEGNVVDASAELDVTPTDELGVTYEVFVSYESAELTAAVGQPASAPSLAGDLATAQSPCALPAQVNRSQDHDQLYARNWAFIDADLQARLATATLFTAGTGLGSLVATLAVRTGFQRFILADGDQVEFANLNRQAFDLDQLGHNKAISTAEQIRRIQPQAEIEIIPRFVDESDFPGLIARSDIIVNTIDFSSPAFVALNRLAHAAAKSVLFPFNLGWGGALLVFTPESATLDEFAGIDPTAPFTQEVVTRLILSVIQRIPGGPPSYFNELLARYAARTPETWPYDPQLGVGTHMTASLVVQAAVSLLAGWPIRIAPEVAWCDARAAMSAFDSASPDPGVGAGVAMRSP
jgi:molybdopterin/thiamine biosynthesis adenylyltransferase